MKITPVTGPGQVQDLSTPEPVREARMKAAFIKASQAPAPAQANPTAQEHPVRNPNAISAEEVSAIRPTLQSKPAQEAETRDNISEVAEEVTPAEVKPAAKDPETERRFQQIARQERALRAKIQQQNIEFKKREEALAAREAAITAPQDLSNYVPKERVKQDALSVLEEAGVSWDELTNQVVNRQPTDPRVNAHISRLEAQIAKLEKANETSAKTYQDQQAAQYQAALKQIRTDAKQLVYTDPEFETVKAMNAVKDVVDLIEETYKKDGVVLSVEEAAKEVENYLVEEAMKITQIDKIKKRMAAANASQPKPEEKTQSTQQSQMKTLTNATSSTRPLTSRERAIAAAEGRLKI